MPQHFNAELHFVGRDVAFDDVMGGNLQVHADNVGTDRLLANMPVNQYRSVDPTSAQLRQIGTGAQKGVAFKKHIVDNKQGGIGKVQLAQKWVLSQFRVCMQDLEVIGITLDLQGVKRQFWLAGLTRKMLL